MRYGLNCGPPGLDMWAKIRAATAPFPGWRCYSPPVALPETGVPPAWPGTASGPKPAEATFVIASIKPDVPSVISGSLDDELRQFIAGAATGDYWTCWHEGETDEGWTPEEIIAMHRHVHALSRAARPDIKYGQISAAYTATAYSAFRPLTQWIAKGMDFQGIDGYRANQKATVASTFEAARLQILKAAPKARVTVCEVNGVNPGRAQFLHDVHDWAVLHKCPTFFPFVGDKYPWDPADQATINEIKREVG